MAATYLKDRAKIVGYGLSRFADWHTGRNCHPSDTRLAAVTGVTTRTAQRGRHDLEAAGFIRRTGRQAKTQPVDYVLILPTTTDKVVRTDETTTDKVVPSSTDKVVRSGLRDYGQMRRGLRTDETETTDKVVLQPLPTSSRPLGSEEGREGEALAAPAPEGARRSRPSVAEIRATLTAVIPADALNGIDCANTDLADALAAAEAAGWTLDRMAVALTDMTLAKKSPTGQAIARLRDLASKNPAAVILDAATEEARTPPSPGPTCTPTPGNAGAVLSDDPRQPGLDGFGHFDPPTRTPTRPPGFEEAQRQLDQAERQRQTAALHALHTDQENTA